MTNETSSNDDDVRSTSEIYRRPYHCQLVWAKLMYDRWVIVVHDDAVGDDGA